MKVGIKMKKLMVIFLSCSLLLAGCTGSNSLGDTPEDALHKIEKDDREIHVYGSHKVNDELMLLVFRGVMNDKDILVGDVRKKGEQWEANELFQMNGPLDDQVDMETTFTLDELGYEMGYIKSGVAVPDVVDVFEIEGISDWRIWIK